VTEGPFSAPDDRADERPISRTQCGIGIEAATLSPTDRDDSDPATEEENTMRVRATITLAVILALAWTVGCSAGPAKPGDGATGGSVGATGSATASGTAPTEPRVVKMIGNGAATTIFMHTTKVYDPAQYPKTSMNGEPSDIPFFKPVKDEGILNRDYPAYDNKTFKFLSLASGTIAPQAYYMFEKNGGTLNKALAADGYKAVNIVDSGHIKILPNFYVGYYDFAWISVNVLAEYWSGNESMNQELWRDGDDYVIVGNSYNGAISLMVPPGTTDVSQLANTTVGIMNPSFNQETLLQKLLASKGLSTKVTGGTVSIEMGTPGYVMNDLLANKLSGVFAWGMYSPQLQKQGYKEIVPWSEMGYGKKVPYLVLVVRRDILEKHPEIVRKVVQANYDASRQAVKVGDYQEPLLQEYTAFRNKYFGGPVVPSPPALMDIDPQASPVFLKDVVDYMTKAGYFIKPYTYEHLVDESFYAKVKK
jgi:ABC-type nitrate/sulfonate/bicarbonate transport system substrate-binding protein